MDIEVHIERLVLDGLDLEPGGAAALAAALQSELARLVTAVAGDSRGTGFASESPSRMILEPMIVPAGSRPGMLGRRIGESVAGGLAGIDGLTAAGGPAPQGGPNRA